MKGKSAICLVFFSLLSFTIHAQSIKPFGLLPVSGERIVLYAEESSNNTLSAFRRAEIVSLGSIPFVYFGCKFGYSLYRFCASGFDSKYVPNPFSGEFSFDEKKGFVIASASIAVIIGIVDYIVLKVREEESDSPLKNGSVNIKIENESFEIGVFYRVFF